MLQCVGLHDIIRNMSKIIAIGNQKGGTGKTASCFALAEVLAGAYEKRVLMIDLDPQSSLTTAAGVDPEITMAEVLAGESIKKAIKGIRENLWFIPSSIALADVELKSAGVLRKILEPAREAADFIILDLPPSLNFLTANGLVASDYVIIPTRPTLLDVAGMDLFLDVVKQAQALNQALKVAGILFTYYDTRIVSMAEIIKNLKEKDLYIFDSMIGQSIRVAEAVGGSVVTKFPSNPRALEYVKFTQELLKVLK